MAHRSIGQERFGFAGRERAMSSLDALLLPVDWRPVAALLDALYPAAKGEPAQPAEQLMLIVPADGGIHVEAKVLNKDIGFVGVGQPVRIKVEAFPYTEHGIVEGTVAHIGRDSETDEALGLVYPVRITIGTNGPTAARSRQLMPGMAVQAEVVTDRRRVIEYVLSPIERTIGTAGRER